MNTALNESRTEASGWCDGDHRRVHAHRDLAVDLLGDREQLHDVAELARRAMSSAVMLGDALAVHVAGDDARAERDRRDDRGLRRGVEALDVGGRVGLGVAERLRLGERVGERRARLGHAGEDVVRRAVDDAHHAPDAVAGERLAQRPHQRDAAGDRRLEQQVDARRPRPSRTAPRRGSASSSLFAVTTGLPAFSAATISVAGRLDPADDLDDDVDVGIADHGVGVVR